MKTTRYIFLLLLLISVLSCSEEDNILPEEVVLPELTSGTADFSNYVAVGASFTAGFTDGGLFIASQENSFPNILSKEFAKVGGGDFTQPLMNDNTGGMVVGTTPVAAYRLIFNGSATSGGIGMDQTGNFNPATYGFNDITDPSVFGQVFDGIVSALTDTGAKGAVTNVPYITDLPYFTTVPNNALVLDAGTAAQLTGVFQAVSGIFLQGAVLQGVPLAQAQALATQYAITFNEGPNRWIIDVPVTQSNPLGFRQMTEDELLLLTIDRAALAQGYGTVALTPQVLQVLGILQSGGTPTAQQAGLVIAAVNGIDDKDALDTDELASIKTATDAYNSTIAAVANSNENIALVDLNAILTEIASTGIDFDGFNLTADLVTGGAVSLDGIHLNARGYAFMANKFLEAIDASFGSNFMASGNVAKASNYGTIYSAQLP